MKRWPLFLLPIWLVGCSLSDNLIEYPTTQVSPTRIIPYMHLAVGDSLAYGPAPREGSIDPNTNKTWFIAHVEETDVINGRTYYRVAHYPWAWDQQINVLLRQDEDGNIRAIFLSDSGNVADSMESLLYKTSAKIGTTWDIHTPGDTMRFTLMSRSDTVKTYYGVFHNCLRVRFQSVWYACDDHWLAPGVGIVKTDFETIAFPPIYTGPLDLKDLRLKSVSRR